MSANGHTTSFPPTMQPKPDDRSGNPTPARRPLLITTAGRGNIGSTSFLNTNAQFYRERGASFRLWDASQYSSSVGLPAYHPDVERPGSSDQDVITPWLEHQVRDQQQKGYDAILDLAARPYQMAQHAQLSSLLPASNDEGVRLVTIHVLGPLKSDLLMLDTAQREGWWDPRSSVIVLNAGLVQAGCTFRKAFEEVVASANVQRAIQEGVPILYMPALRCWSDLNWKHLHYSAVAWGETPETGGAVSFIDKAEVVLWWGIEVPQFMGQMPPHLMPMIPPRSAPVPGK